MKKLSAIALAFALLGLSACDQDVKITNGQIPQEFIAQVTPLLGTYPGQMERQANALSFQLDGNHLVVTSASDLLGSGCQSRIGNLTQISYKETRDHQIKLTGADFDFDPNLCSHQVLGRKLHIYFDSSEMTAFNVEILDHYDYRQECSWTGGGPYNPPYETCGMARYNVYLEGSFRK